ncbi:DUF4352 domain-containing protein [Actinocorallia sp. A-T 12471]|uniref:DUF4352 domain-containing protein n=1 Tax=Actinocorallia sp. A-T 12471 TaxID=3089813 RepID=UPI0029CE96D9|nr:DUF4352 domain-containing protein [Actinocorallia sp. A-T 12471]MDX6742106.1 DUF4352 domain-containing protein [Actinocorallia sp. A-T 12471]
MGIWRGLMVRGVAGVVVVAAVGCAPEGDGLGGGWDLRGGTREKPLEDGGLREKVRDGDVVFRVTGVKKGPGRIGVKDAEGRFVFVHVTVRNEGDDPVFFAGAEQKLIVDGKAHTADAEATARLGDKARSLLTEIAPGGRLKGIVVFDIPKKARLSGIELHASAVSRGVLVPLDAG